MKSLDPWLNLADELLGVSLTRVLLPCLAASAIATAVVLVEAVFGTRHRQWYLVYNLALAWIPIFFAWASYRLAARGSIRSLSFWGCSMGWLLFLPNAPYLFTDLVHLLGKSLPHYWPDMIKILLFALAGSIVGMVSLQLMHGLVARWKGWWAGWMFVALTSALCSVGVALGRFRRWNSWDALHDPTNILKDAFDLTKNPYVSSTSGWFCVLLTLFLFCTYAMFHSLRHAPPHPVYVEKRNELEESAEGGDSDGTSPFTEVTSSASSESIGNEMKVSDRAGADRR